MQFNYTKVENGNSVVLVDKDVWIRFIEITLDDAKMFEKVKIKKGILNFSINYEGRINNHSKSYEKSCSLAIDQYKKIKVVGSRPGILCGF